MDGLRVVRLNVGATRDLRRRVLYQQNEAVSLERVVRDVGSDLVHDWVDERSIIVLLLRKR